MTKQEQIEEMQKTICANCKDKYSKKGYVCPWQDKDTKCYNCEKLSEALYNASYGNISEYKTEREMLESQIKVLEQRLNDKYIEIDNLNRDYRNAFERLKSQQREIEYRKKQYDNKLAENTRLYIEYDKLKDDYAKLQELFAQYQMASNKEMIAQKKEAEKRFENNMKSVLEIEKKQAVKEFAENLKTRFEEKEQHYICMYDWNGHSAVTDCENEVDELLKEYKE